MITKQQMIQTLLPKPALPVKEQATAFSPANIALIKYWGKRDNELNLPVTSSLSMSLAHGTHTTVKVASADSCLLNGKECPPAFAKRLFDYCNLFRNKDTFFEIHTTNEIPTAAGFASSSSGFSALILALDDLFGWHADLKTLSILARLGSGSACRSLFSGFVEWHKGTRPDGLDSFAEPLNTSWPELQIEMLPISSSQKPIDSRSAMKITVETSPLYSSWPQTVANDLPRIKEAINSQNFHQLGQIAESNALAMHATMLASHPPILYFLPESIATMHHIWRLRNEGLPLYFTMDAGPNLKLLYLKKDSTLVHEALGL
jgi:diphosphomevalonate decarboxylase